MGKVKIFDSRQNEDRSLMAMPDYSKAIGLTANSSLKT